MKILYQDDKYKISSYLHHDQYLDVKKWCFESFGNGWGHAESGPVDRFFSSVCMFTFNRLYHAQWFELKWAEIIDNN